MSAGEWLPLRCRRSIPVNGCRWRCRRSIPVNGCRRWITVAAAGCGTLVADVCREGRRAESIAEIFSSILRLRADCPMLEAISSLIFVILPGIGRFRKNKRRNFVYFDCQVDFRQNRRSFCFYGRLGRTSTARRRRSCSTNGSRRRSDGRRSACPPPPPPTPQKAWSS